MSTKEIEMNGAVYDSFRAFEDFFVDAKLDALERVEEAVERREAGWRRVLEKMETARNVVVVFDENGDAALYRTNKISDLFRAFRWERFACKIANGDLVVEFRDFNASRRFALRELAPGAFPSGKRKIALRDTLPLIKKFKETLVKENIE